MEQPVDKGVRKFRGMIVTQFVLLGAFALTGWFGWPEGLFSTLTMGVCGSFLSFAVPNVVEKIWPLLQRKPAAPSVPK